MIMCDYNNLKYFMTSKSLIRRQTHWTEFLISFEFKIQHKAEKKNSADKSFKRSNYKTKKKNFNFVIKIDQYDITKSSKSDNKYVSWIDIVWKRRNNNKKNAKTMLSNANEEQNMNEKNSKFAFSLLKEIKQYTKKNVNMTTEIMNESNKFKIIDELIFHDENQIYVSKKIRLRVLKDFHDNSTATHFERDKILKAIKKWVYWSKINNLVESYVNTCDTCMRTKLSKHSFHEKLLSLSISNKAWSNITVNFVTDLSKFSLYKSANVFDCVMMTVDKFTKMTHYFSCVKTMNSKQFAFLLIKDVINHHDLFERIISDRKSLFISHFWIILSKKLKANHKLSSTFHSQTNDQIERQNQTLKQYLKSVINFLQNDWIDYFF